VSVFNQMLEIQIPDILLKQSILQTISELIH